LACQGVVRNSGSWVESEPGFAFGYAVAVFIRTRFERKLVGRPGLEPGTTGLKVLYIAYFQQLATTTLNS